MSGDDKPTGFATLVEAIQAIAAHEQAKRFERRVDRKRLALPKSEPQRRPLVR